MTVETHTMEGSLHKAMVAWQERHFRDYRYLVERWSRFYVNEPFRLVSKLAPLKEETIEVGEKKGRARFRQAREMDEETLARCRSIIRAQASTELGSIQQHRESLHKAADERLQFDVLRVMAEEYRHGYQMMYLLASDDWGANVAQETIDEILSMETGSHVLDAFNVYFDSFVDNIVFAAVIDRVGKYQLSMQRVFAYAPMAQSMMPMLVEEAFHLTTGVEPLKRWVRDAALDRGNISIESIQRHLNKWIPRGLEMFGDERGGETNVRLGLKDLTNAEAIERYHHECQEEVVDVLNIEIVRAKKGARVPREQALETARRILETGETVDDVGPGELLLLPPKNFFRRRGVHAFEMCDFDGRAFGSLDDYLSTLRRSLPEAYVSGKDVSTYIENLRKHHGGVRIQEGRLPFYG